MSLTRLSLRDDTDTKATKSVHREPDIPVHAFMNTIAPNLLPPPVDLPSSTSPSPVWGTYAVNTEACTLLHDVQVTVPVKHLHQEFQRLQKHHEMPEWLQGAVSSNKPKHHLIQWFRMVASSLMLSFTHGLGNAAPWIKLKRGQRPVFPVAPYRVVGKAIETAWQDAFRNFPLPLTTEARRKHLTPNDMQHPQTALLRLLESHIFEGVAWTPALMHCMLMGYVLYFFITDFEDRCFTGMHSCKFDDFVYYHIGHVMRVFGPRFSLLLRVILLKRARFSLCYKNVLEVCCTWRLEIERCHKLTCMGCDVCLAGMFPRHDELQKVIKAATLENFPKTPIEKFNHTFQRVFRVMSHCTMPWAISPSFRNQMFQQLRSLFLDAVTSYMEEHLIGYTGYRLPPQIKELMEKDKVLDAMTVFELSIGDDLEHDLDFAYFVSHVLVSRHHRPRPWISHALYLPLYSLNREVYNDYVDYIRSVPDCPMLSFSAFQIWLEILGVELGHALVHWLEKACQIELDPTKEKALQLPKEPHAHHHEKAFSFHSI